ncbi:MAG: FAD-dependent oxidoreductase [Acidobacteria bacterium]|nr:FAD-dependent oxidoreductase [Acidobacteriota bacterium]
MRVCIVGNGLAGAMFAKSLRDLGGDMDIDIYGEEPYLYYPRPNMIEYLAGRIPFERMFAFEADWYDKRRLGVHLKTPVTGLFPDLREIEIAGNQRETYDVLAVASGARSFVPPIKGADSSHVFTFRTLDECRALIDRLQKKKGLIILGGGLLGLEIARGARARGADVDVVEFFGRLLPRQLDEEGAALLRKQIEGMGIRVHLGRACREIRNDGENLRLQFKEGEDMVAESTVIAAGVRPNIDLAQSAGLETDKGLVVNDGLQTSHPSIYGIGDAVQFRDRVYGIIPAAFEQARTASRHVIGEDVRYTGTIPSNTLKIAGLDVTSVGLVNPENEETEEIGWREEERGMYKKLVLRDGMIIGAIWMGTKQGIGEINRLIAAGTSIEQWKNDILHEDFDFSVIL